LGAKSFRDRAEPTAKEVESSCDPPVKKLDVGLVSEPLDSAEPTAFAGVAEAEFNTWLRKP
jgi:hypothetical protein